MYNDIYIYIKLLFTSYDLVFLTIAKKKVFFHALYFTKNRVISIESVSKAMPTKQSLHDPDSP